MVSHCGRAAGEKAQRSSNPQSRCASVEECTSACESGNAGSCYSAAVEYEIGEKVEQDYSRAADLYERACNEGAAGGCNNLGVLYEIGLSRDQDERKAGSLYDQACQGGDQYGCDNQQRREKR
jgi:uncharacterized protein